MLTLPEEGWPDVTNLSYMMEHRELSEYLKYGGTADIFKRLETSERGLDPDNLKREFRQEKFAF